MLPRRQPSAARARSPHARVGVRQAILSALAVVFVLGLYMNFRFLSQSGSSSASVGRDPLAPGKPKQQQQLKQQLTFETREVKHIAFTSGCSDLDFIRSEALAHSLRGTGYKHNVTHLVYGCSHGEFESLQRKKNPRNRVEHVGFPVVRETQNVFGEGLVASTLHFKVIDQWFKQELNRNRLKDDDFVMLVESDAVFTKKPDIWNLYREVEDIEDPRWFGQDAAWYEPKQLPLKTEELEQFLPAKSPALKLKDWRDYAATGPYVVEVSLLREMLPTVVPMWEKMEHKKRHLALPFAAAHHSIPIGISGALNVHHYPSRYENWDFVDDIKYNPINETARPRDIEMLSFPITVRAYNFTLQQWIDGREWNFYYSQIPNDFFHCDAWLLSEPDGYVWYLASTTRGYERTPTILRRRHIMAVSMMLQAYNAAASAYKKEYCPKGFNTNKRIPMVHNGKPLESAVAYAGKSAATKDSTLYGDLKRIAELKPVAGQEDSDDVHFVFVTGCKPDDHWQSDLLAQSFADVGQRGRLSRVVAGCSDEELKHVMERTLAAYPFLQLFSTKSYADSTAGDVYAPYNKPFGLRDWLRDSNPPVLETLVVFINADFIFTRRLTFNSGHRVTTPMEVDSRKYDEDSEVIEGLRVYKPFFVYQGERLLEKVTDSVTSGLGLAQRGSLPAGWEATVRRLCPECGAVTDSDLREYYSPNPPIVLARQDLKVIIDDYCAMSVKVHSDNPSSVAADIIGFAIAVAKHKIKFTSFKNLALTGAITEESNEYWDFLEFVKQRNPCDEKEDQPTLIAEGPRAISSAASFRITDARNSIEWIYDKKLVPANIFACDTWLLTLPPKTLWLDAKKSSDKQQVKQAYGVCTSIKLLNDAIVKQRQRVCRDGFSHNKRLRLVSPRPSDVVKVGRLDPKWEEAANAVRR